MAKSICHVVSVIENGNLSRIHLLKTITTELNAIQALQVDLGISLCFRIENVYRTTVSTDEMYSKLSSLFVFEAVMVLDYFGYSDGENGEIIRYWNARTNN